MGSNEHDHDSHYHGEPSRILDDTPLPERVILYEQGFAPTGESGSSSPEEDRRFWVKYWRTVPEVETLIVPDGEVDPSGDELTVRASPETKTNPFHPDFAGFDAMVRESSSVLLVPARLRISPGAVEDLKSNDVSVNWLALAPDTSPDPLPGAAVLSDWVTRVSPTLPPARSTGVATGILHLRSHSLEIVETVEVDDRNFCDVLQAFIDHPESKLRPVLFRNREWSLFPED